MSMHSCAHWNAEFRDKTLRTEIVHFPKPGQFEALRFSFGGDTVELFLRQEQLEQILEFFRKWEAASRAVDPVIEVAPCEAEGWGKG